MSDMARKVMLKFYRDAEGDASKLPWHREEPSPILAAAVERCPDGGRALDVGCGAGVFTVWLAQRGMKATGLDLFPEAIAMAEAHAKEHGVEAELVAGDLFSWEAPEAFDLVYDSGCLHSLVGGDVASYKRQLLRWLAPDGRFALEHWGKRHALDWRPIGPRRRTRKTIEAIFAPELTLEATEFEDFKAPFPFGPKVRGVSYRFRRTGSRE